MDWLTKAGIHLSHAFQSLRTICRTREFKFCCRQIFIATSMAEAFGIVAAVIGVVDVGTRVAVQLLAIRHAWKKAPLEILALSNEVSDLNIVMHYTKGACESAKPASTNPDFIKVLDEHIRSAQLHLSEVTDILYPLLAMKELKRKTKWLKMKARLMAKRNDLKMVRTRIRDLLQAHHMWVPQEIPSLKGNSFILYTTDSFILGYLDLEFSWSFNLSI